MYSLSDTQRTKTKNSNIIEDLLKNQVRMREKEVFHRNNNIFYSTAYGSRGCL